MGKKSPKLPSAPDYTSIANQQAAQQKEAWNTALNASRPDQSNPFGKLNWTQNADGSWNQDVSFNPQQQEIFNTQQGNQQGIANAFGNALKGYDTSQLDFSGAPGMPQVGQYSQQATDLYNQLALPGLQRQRSGKEAQMAAMGLGLGSGRAYDTQQELLNDSENRSGMMGAQAGITQGNTMFGQGMQLHQQGIQDMLQQKAANLGQLSGLYGLGSQLGTPQFAGVSGVNPYQTADLMGAAKNSYDAQVAQANAKAASGGGLMGTIGGLAGTALGSMAGPMGAALGGSLGSSLFGGGGGGGGIPFASSGSGSSYPTGGTGFNW